MVDHAKIVERLAELRTNAEAAAAEKLVIKVELNEAPLPEPPRRWYVGLTPAWSDYLSALPPAACLRWLSWAEQRAAPEALAKMFPHAYVDDCWYSCGKTDGCRDDQSPDVCDCGADDRRDAFLAGLAGALGLEET